MKRIRMKSLSQTLSLAAVALTLTVSSSAWAVPISVDAPSDGSLARVIHPNNAGHSGADQGYVDAGGDPVIMFFGFDVSAYSGYTADGDATLTVSTWQQQPERTIGVRALNSYNADMDFSDASTAYRDPTTNTYWQDNSGSNLTPSMGSGGEANIASAVLDTVVIPASTPDDTQFQFTIPQATLQAMLDGTAPSIFVFEGTGYERFDRWMPGQQDAGPLPNLSFDATVPEPSSFALAGIGLIGLVGWGIRRRKA